MLAAAVLWMSAVLPSPAPTDAQLVELQQRQHGMHVVLMRLDQAGSAAARPLMDQHWNEAQAYMAALLKLIPPPAPRKGRPDCRVGIAWSPLSLPASTDPGYYLVAMQSLDQQLREELRQAQHAESPFERIARLQAHWSHTYVALQDLRGLGWLFGRWLPTARDSGVLPEPDSDGARVLGTYCTQCHAAPPPSLHTAAEWQALTATMDRHMERSDTPIPICVTVMPADDARVLDEYLQRHGRAPAALPAVKVP